MANEVASSDVGCALGRSPAYIEWLKEEAAKINSDGCTCVTEWHQACCFEHDLSWSYGRDPMVAFTAGWSAAPVLSCWAANWRFKRCNGSSLRSWVRFLGVTVGAAAHKVLKYI